MLFMGAQSESLAAGMHVARQALSFTYREGLLQQVANP